MEKREIEKGIGDRVDRWMSYYSACFDFIIKTTEMIFAKALGNIDSIREGQAERMKRIAEATEGDVVVVGERTSSGRMEDGVVYERYGVKAVTPETFFSMIEGDFPMEIRKRGGKYRVIDPDMLRKRRMDHGLSQARLAEIVGTTKKTIYMHERREMLAEKGLVDMIESLIGRVSKPVKEKRRRETREEMSVVDAGLFDIVAKDGFSVYIKQYPSEKHISYLSEFTKRLEEKTLIVTGRKVRGMVSVTPEEFRKMSREDLFSMFS